MRISDWSSDVCSSDLAADVKAEQTSGSPTLDVKFDRAAIARYGLTIEEVADTVAAAMGGREAGLLFEGDRRFAVTVRVPAGTRESLDALAALPVLLPQAAGEHRTSEGRRVGTEWGRQVK